MIRTRSVLLLLGALALFPAACADESDNAPTGAEQSGDEGDTDELTVEEQEFADAFSVTLQDDENGLGVEADDADCMAAAVMRELGVEPFDDAGVTPDDIEVDGKSSPGELLGDGTVTDEQAEAIVGVWGSDCVDLVDVLVSSAGSEFGLDPEGEACFNEGFAEGDLATKLLAATFTSEDGTPDSDTMAAFFNILQTCGEGENNPLVAGIAESLAADGSLTDEQALCLAQGVVDELGAQRMGELFGSGDFEQLDEAAQNEVTGALLQAAGACDVPLSAFG